MADPTDEQDYFGGLDELLGKHGLPPAIGMGLGAALTQGLAGEPPPTLPLLPAGHLLGRLPSFAPPALGASVQPISIPTPGNADNLSQELGQEAAEEERPDLGGWNYVRDFLPRGFTRDLFDNYMQGKGDYELKPERFQDIVNMAKALRQPEPTNVTGPNGEMPQRRTYDFRDSPDYKRSLGSASLFYDKDGKPVGFYDNYNFDPAIDKRTLIPELETRAMHAMHPFLPATAEPFKIKYGVFVPQPRIGGGYLSRYSAITLVTPRGKYSRIPNHMLLFAVMLMVAIYYVIPVLATGWSIYGLIMWRGIWRILALPPLIFAFTGFYYLVWLNDFHIPAHGGMPDVLFDANLAIIPYVLFVQLFRNDALKKRETPDTAQ